MSLLAPRTYKVFTRCVELGPQSSKRTEYAKLHMLNYFESLILKELENSSSDISVEGTSSPSALFLSLLSSPYSLLSLKKHLIIAPHEKDAQEMVGFLNAHGRDSYFLPEFEVSPYTSLSPKSSMSSLRIQFLHHICQNNSKPSFFPPVFVATLSSLAQKSISLNFLTENTYNLKVGDLIPEPIDEFLLMLGYQSTSVVEIYGQYSLKGSILDIFSPAHKFPIRVELFGDEIHSLRSFDIESQRSLDSRWPCLTLIPASEFFLTKDNTSLLLKSVNQMTKDRGVDPQEIEILRLSIRNQRPFQGQEFLIHGFWHPPSLPKDFMPKDLLVWWPHKEININSWYSHIEDLQQDYQNHQNILIRPDLSEIMSLKTKNFIPSGQKIYLNEVAIKELKDFDINPTVKNNMTPPLACTYNTSNLKDFLTQCQVLRGAHDKFKDYIQNQWNLWTQQGISIFICTPQEFSKQRVEQFLKSSDISFQILNSFEDLSQKDVDFSSENTFLLSSDSYESLFLKDDRMITLKFKDLFGRELKKNHSHSNEPNYFNKLDSIRFGELSKGDFIVHIQHGLGKFSGLKTLNVQEIPSEFIEIKYKNNDKLLLPIHRINQIKLYGGPTNDSMIDKLGGTSFEKAKIKVKNQLRDIANDLLKIYAQRAALKRPPLELNPDDLFAFENEFDFEETHDQLSAIESIQKDLLKDQPMDRLICGDVGFGKTEVSMRAAFQVLSNKKQVAVLAPTTVLAFQHLNSFQKRFEHWGFCVKGLHRFISASEIKNTLKALSEGQVDLVIGTHRLLSKDVQFKNLGLLICDEEQKFGVRHKEQIRKIRSQIDTLTLSATPIPRTLNMGLLGLRDLSLITTAPIDRQPIRTFVTKFNPEIVKKAVLHEIQRGGQVFYVHNRVQSIYSLHEELKTLFPKLRIAVAHGQMPEHELEKTMMSFIKKDFDILLCTTIIESGVDIPNANTMFIDNAHQFGLSQLYQLRGRVGRSRNRAHCYLLIPKNRQLEKKDLERLKILQENTSLGSGIRIAHYDLEIRGAGNILGEDQSGQVNVVGYDLYMDLLHQAIQDVQGHESSLSIDPDINIPLPALIPSSYISDIRIRLSYYKILSNISTPEDIEHIESDLSDQFGKPPPEVINLFTMMLVKKTCKEKGIKAISSGPKNLKLQFDSSTKISVQRVLELCKLPNKKYKLLNNDHLLIRMNEISWSRIYEDIQFL